MRKPGKVALFLIITFSLSIVSALVFHSSGLTFTGIAGTLFGTFYMFIPMLSVLIVEKLVYKSSIRQELFISFKLNKWFFIAWLFTPFLSIGAMGVSLMFPAVSFSSDVVGFVARYEDILPADQLEKMKYSLEAMPFHPFWLILFQGLIAGITINALAGFGEELGWRGFLLKEYKNKGFIHASLVIGFIWGIWHFPVILMGHNYPAHPTTGIFMMTVFCILLTPLFLYITIKSKSVLAASIMHGTINATSGLGILVINGGNDLTVGLTGLAGFIFLSIIIFLVFIYDRYVSKESIMTSKIDKFI